MPVRRGVRLLVVDNHDSFLFNLVDYAAVLGAACRVVDRDDLARGDAAAADAVLISPGPGRPEAAGRCLDLVQDCVDDSRPLLGVCLGHQVIATALGAVVDRGVPVHGVTSKIEHDGYGVFTGLPERFSATRYHSLQVEPASIGGELELSAWTEDGSVMGVRHATAPVEGVQFHPESVLSEHGHRMLAAFLGSVTA